MDDDVFDDLARTALAGVKTRRSWLRLLAGSALMGVGARVGLPLEADAKHRQRRTSPGNKERRPAKPGAGGELQAQGKHKKKHHHKPAKNPQKPEPCPEGQGRCPDGTCLAWDACCPDAIPPLCGACEDEVCDAGVLVCRSRCQYADSVCCNGQCVLPCSNGCKISDDCGSCSTAPAGKVYCAAQDRCVNASCPAGQKFDAATCQCKDRCPSGASIVCPPVPAYSDWKDIFGDEYSLPEGCCGMRYWWEDANGVISCSTPGHHVPSVTYRCDG